MPLTRVWQRTRGAVCNCTHDGRSLGPQVTGLVPVRRLFDSGACTRGWHGTGACLARVMYQTRWQRLCILAVLLLPRPACGRCAPSTTVILLAPVVLGWGAGFLRAGLRSDAPAALRGPHKRWQQDGGACWMVGAGSRSVALHFAGDGPTQPPSSHAGRGLPTRRERGSA